VVAPDVSQGANTAGTGRRSRVGAAERQETSEVAVVGSGCLSRRAQAVCSQREEDRGLQKRAASGGRTEAVVAKNRDTSRWDSAARTAGPDVRNRLSTLMPPGAASVEAGGPPGRKTEQRSVPALPEEQSEKNP
jgi:hypothetical protein